MKRVLVLAAAAAACLLACKKDATGDARGPMERAGSWVDDAAQKTGQGLEKAADATGRGLERAGHEVEGAFSKEDAGTGHAPEK